MKKAIVAILSGILCISMMIPVFAAEEEPVADPPALEEPSVSFEQLDTELVWEEKDYGVVQVNINQPEDEEIEYYFSVSMKGQFLIEDSFILNEEEIDFDRRASSMTADGTVYGSIASDLFLDEPENTLLFALRAPEKGIYSCIATISTEEGEIASEEFVFNFTDKMYEVSYFVDDECVQFTKMVAGSTPEFMDKQPGKQGMVFLGWGYSAKDENPINLADVRIEKDTNFYALFRPKQAQPLPTDQTKDKGAKSPKTGENMVNPWLISGISIIALLVLMSVIGSISAAKKKEQE